MRIIGGRYRGKKLIEHYNETTRPTSDRVRENIFNVLGARLNGAVVLDLFAGTGMFGLEALSRGARSVTFVDSDAVATAVVRKNLDLLKRRDCATKVFNLDAFLALDAVRNTQFDIIFLDPPYSGNMGERAIEYIITQNMLAPDGVIVFETDASRPSINFENLSVSSKKYGRARVYFIS